MRFVFTLLWLHSIEKTYRLSFKDYPNMLTKLEQVFKLFYGIVTKMKLVHEEMSVRANVAADVEVCVNSTTNATWQFSQLYTRYDWTQESVRTVQ
jgi:hypothetical protein